MSCAAGEYDAALRDIIHALKYGGHTSLASGLSSMMLDAGEEVLRGADAVVPVPLHWRRRWKRGFNQALLLTERLDVPVWPALARVRNTTSQVGLSAETRRVNLRKAFALRRRLLPWQVDWKDTVKGKTVVLVDDVATTGATLQECAKVLCQAGAREVRALTAARVPGIRW